MINRGDSGIQPCLLHCFVLLTLLCKIVFKCISK